MYKPISSNMEHGTHAIRKSTSLSCLQRSIIDSYSTDYLKEAASKGIGYLNANRNEAKAVARNPNINFMLDNQAIKDFFYSAHPSVLYFFAGNNSAINIVGIEGVEYLLKKSYKIRRKLAKTVSIVQMKDDHNISYVDRLLNDKSPKVRCAVYSNAHAIKYIKLKDIVNQLEFGPIQNKIALASNEAIPSILGLYHLMPLIVRSQNVQVRMAAASNYFMVLRLGKSANELLNDSNDGVIEALLKNNAYIPDYPKLHILARKSRHPKIRELVTSYLAFNNMRRR